MYLSSMRIQNYRNFKDITMTFHPLANYLVGENDIGKSSFLRLLSYMANAWTLPENDYDDPNQPIRITLDLHLLKGPEEYFADTPQEHLEKIRVRLEMKVTDICPICTTGKPGRSFLWRPSAGSGM